MEISGVLRKAVAQAVINLIEEPADIARMLVFDRDPCAPGKRHGDIAVHSAKGIDIYQRGIHRVALSEAEAEEIPQRRLDRRLLLTVPVHPEDKVTKHESVCLRRLVGNGDPDVVHHSAALYIGDLSGLSRLQGYAGSSLSADAESACGFSAGSALPFRVFGIYCP